MYVLDLVLLVCADAMIMSFGYEVSCSGSGGCVVFDM